MILSFPFLLAIFGTGAYLLYRSRVTPSSPQPQGKVTPPPSVPPLKLRANSRPDGAEGRGSYGLRGGEEGLLSRLIAFGIFWFFITLSVESSIIPIVDVIFEHRLYLPSVGFVIVVAGLIALVWERIVVNNNRMAKITPGLFALVIIILSGATFARNTVWQSQVSLWEDVVKKSPMKARTYNGLGLAYEGEAGLMRRSKALRRRWRSIPLMPLHITVLRPPITSKTTLNVQ